MMTEDVGNNIEVEMVRVRHAFWLAIIGLFLSAAITIILVNKGDFAAKGAEEIVAVVGLFTSVTGTLVGMFFGLQVGSAGAEHERRNRQNAEHLARLALSHLTPDVAKELLKDLNRKS